jgi:hypothetical protein
MTPEQQAAERRRREELRGTSRFGRNLGPTVSPTSPSGKPRSSFNQDLRWIGGLLAAPFNPTMDAITGYFRAPSAATADFTGLPDSTPGSTIPAPSKPGTTDWSAIIAALSAQDAAGPGVGVRRDLFRLSETPEEAAMLERELADIEARRAAGDIALRSGWGNVQSANAAAAEKARSLINERGETSAAIWSQAAQQARDLAAERAGAAGQFEGRAGIDVSPDAGVADWAGFMESQAPAERRFAERQQEILGSDLDWMAGMAGSQAEAYAGDLRRQASVMSFERAREHNLRVQDRVNQERMMLAQMEQSASAANAQLSAQRGTMADRVLPLLPTVMLAGESGPALLASATGLDPAIAAELVRSYGSGIGGQSLQAQLNNLLTGRG